MSLPSPLYAGDAVTSTVTFKNAAGTVADPTTVTLKYKAGSANTVTWTYLGTGSITKTSTGIYAAVLDTSALPGYWVIEWIGTGTVAVTVVDSTYVKTPPL